MADFNTAGTFKTDDGSQDLSCFNSRRNLIDDHSSKTSSSNQEAKTIRLHKGEIVNECTYPKVPHMRSEEARLRTFSNWPSSSPVQPNDLVEAGLFYVPKPNRNDLVQCFCCGGMLKAWREGDVPWSEHSKFYPNCFFILGHEVGNILMELKSDSSKNVFSNKERDEDPLKTLEKLQSEKLCKVCMDNDISIAFIPCGHLVTCRKCSNSVEKCPVCCASITQKIIIYS